MELVVFVKGFDVVFNQNVHSGSSYVAEEFVWNATFAPMYDATPEEGVVLNMDKIDDYNMLS
jgi:inward rectifier potassium channel